MPSVAANKALEQPVTGEVPKPLARWWRASEPYVYLLYLLFLGIEPAFSPDRSWLPTILLVAVFVPIYVASVHFNNTHDRPKLIVAVAAMAVLGVVGMAFQLNVNSTIFFIYAAAAATRESSARTAWIVVLLAFALLAVTFFLSHVPLEFRWVWFLPPLILVPGIAASQVFDTERKRQNTRLRLSQDEVKRLATIAERERISRDLHDLLGHTLSTITLKSALGARLARSDPTRAENEMREVEAISRDSLDQVREAVRGYQARGLAEEIEGVRQVLATAGIAFDMDLAPTDLAPRQESAIALALREGATNVVRHSDASRVRAALVADGQDVVLTVADNGRGGGIEGNGLSGIRHRVHALGGSFSRTTDDGTTLTVRLPRSGGSTPTSAESSE